MRTELLERLRKVTPEEEEILAGDHQIRKELYVSGTEFVIDSGKMLQKGRLIEIRPHTRFAHFPSHRHNYIEMIYVCTGSITHIINGTDRVVQKEGDLLFLNRNVYHEILPAGMEDVAVNFMILPDFFDRPVSMIERENILRDFLISAIRGDKGQYGFLMFSVGGNVPVQNLLENMIVSLMDHGPGMNTINQTSMGLLLMYLSMLPLNEHSRVTGSSDQNLVFRILGYINTDFRQGTLSEISDRLGLPAYTVSRLLKKHAGSGFKELQQVRRLQQAAYLLEHTTLTNDSIMDMIGYENSSYYYNCFRERYGCSPADYRRHHRERIEGESQRPDL